MPVQYMPQLQSLITVCNTLRHAAASNSHHLDEMFKNLQLTGLWSNKLSAWRNDWICGQSPHTLVAPIP